MGVVERTFFPMSLANPDPVSKLRSRALGGCCVTARVSPVGGRKVPPSGRGWGQREGRCGGRSEHSEGSLTPPGWVYTLESPRSW